MTFSIRIGDFEYALDLDVPTSSFKDTSVAVSVEATRKRIKNPGLASALDDASFKAEVRLENYEAGAVLVIDIGGNETSLPVDDVYGADSLINHIPGALYGAGDPNLGCLIRAGLSTAIDQIKKCWAAVSKLQAPDEGRTRFQVKHLWGCLCRSIPNMSVTSALRAVRCIASAGFG